MKKILAAVILSFCALGAVDSFARVITPPAPRPQVVERVKSLFNGELAVVDYAGVRYLLAQSRFGEVLQSTMDLDHKDKLGMDYLQVMALLTGLHPDPALVYDLGLGGGGLIRFHLHHYSKSRIDSAEIDPNVIGLAKKYFDVQSPRHRIFYGEGFDVLQRQGGKYDVIWVDDVLSKKGPKAFIKTEYLKTLRDRLAARGILVANLGEASKPEFYSEVVRDYRRDYSRGILIKSPIPHYVDAMQSIRMAAFPGAAPKIPARLPAYLIAVGDEPSLNCARFWELYRKWTAERVISVSWGPGGLAPPSDACRDLQ